MKSIPKKQFIFGSVFLYANKLQIIGDRMDPDVTMKQWLLIIMTAQFKNPPTLTELGDFMGCSRQNVKKLAHKLEEKGLVKLVTDSSDARALRIVLTAACESYYKNRGLRESKYMDDLFQGMSESDLEQLNNLLYRMGKNIFRIYEMTNQESSKNESLYLS